MPADMTSLSWWVAELGPSGVGLFIVWRVLLFLKPHVESLIPLLKDLVIGHCRLMSVMETHLTNGAATLKKVSETQDGHGEFIKEIHANVVK